MVNVKLRQYHLWKQITLFNRRMSSIRWFLALLVLCCLTTGMLAKGEQLLDGEEGEWRGGWYSVNVYVVFWLIVILEHWNKF